MTEDFAAAIAFVLRAEGGYTLDPNDPGGETKFGISKKAYPQLDIKNLTVEEATEIYRKDFWQACGCDQLPSPFAISLFDAAVNMGVKRAVRILQISLGVADVDGVVGPVTISTAFKATAHTVSVFLAQRIQTYNAIIAANPKLSDFALNWYSRVCDLAGVVLAGKS